ncbi:hypothetical protein BCR22_11905 [Enterococcus plantarum]|uniref:BspA family leucine-rich repeat surface protein n=1 Tax=Enterococcus plantarum TaxID=1077675 RepID=UPI00084DD4C3|nr:BspA family leucine-rich repeat surface protein [Enterococcus plantarum]OEG18069.1 hypothetical protein BCR22_11905 [Enterococcus plantarum]
MNKKFFLYVCLLSIGLLQFLFPKFSSAQTGTETILEANFSDKEQTSREFKEKLNTSLEPNRVAVSSDDRVKLKNLESNAVNIPNETTTERTEIFTESKDSKEIKANALSTTTEGTWGNVKWTFDSISGALTFTSGGTFEQYISAPWNKTDGTGVDKSSVKSIILSQYVNAPPNSNNLFQGLSNVTEFQGLAYLDTSSTTKMSGMFQNMSSIEFLDLSSFDTSKVTEFYLTFANMLSLKSIDLAKFNTSSATRMSNMFQNDTSLNDIDVSNFNTSNVTDMYAMFSGLTGVTKLNLGNFDFSKTTNYANMFRNVPIEEITLSSTFSNKNADANLQSITKTSTYNGQWKNSSGELFGSSSEFLKNFNGLTDAGTYTWAMYPTWGSVHYDFDSTTGGVTFLDEGILGGYSLSPWNRTDNSKINAADIKSITFTKAVKAPINSTNLFSSSVDENLLKAVTSINGLVNLDTSAVTKMEGLFSGMYSLETLDVSNFNTSSVTSMHRMFTSLRSLKKLDVSNFDTSKVTNMKNMFQSSTGLTSLNLSNFNTASVDSMYAMFNGLSNLKDLNLTSFNTEKVTDMSKIFSGMTSLTTLNISTFNTLKVANMTNMFLNDLQLNRLVLGKFFSTGGKATDLPSISRMNGYTGNWMNESTNVSAGASDTFLKDYNGSNPGTYVWQRQLWNDVPWEFDETAGILRFLDAGRFNESKYSPWNRTDDLKVNAADIKKIVFTKAVTAPSDSSYLFSSLSPRSNRLRSLTSIEGIENLDTSQVINMSNMFYDMTNIVSLDLSTLNTNKATNFYSMFEGASSLEELNITNFNTQNGSTKNMFFGDNNLSKITLGSNFKGQATGLPDVPKNDLYSGTWVYQIKNQTVGTSQEFLANYDGQNPGTYVWGSAEDPLNPTDPNQDNLVLKSVPTAYTFKSKLFYSSYKVDGTVSTDNQVVVYNNRMERNWSVKASIVGDRLTLKNGTSIIPVNSFTINSSNILDPQTKGIVAESPTDKTISNNVGDVQTDVSNISIGFTDTDNQLKAGSELQGTIRYQLYNTASAE